MLTKEHLIKAIQQINRSARAEWLALFDTSALQRYLDHLEQALEPRGGHSIWVRPRETPAVVTREPVA
jgi:hypothetical protein